MSPLLFESGLRSRCRAAPMLAASVLLLAGCGGSSGSGTTGASTAPSSSSAPTSQASTAASTPTVDPAIVHWKKRWQSRGAPVRHAVKVMVANTMAAVNGDSSASFRLTSAFDKLSNCRNPLELPPLSRTPSVLHRARVLSLTASRAFYVGTSTVVKGLNSASSSTVSAGLSRIRRGERLLERAAAAVKKAPTRHD